MFDSVITLELLSSLQTWLAVAVYICTARESVGTLRADEAEKAFLVARCPTLL